MSFIPFSQAAIAHLFTFPIFPAAAEHAAAEEGIVFQIVSLYNTLMLTKTKRRETLFSEARFVVLRVLYAAPEGVSLREIAYRSERPIRVVQVALDSLLRIGIVQKRRMGQRIIFSLKKNHTEYRLLMLFLETLVENEIREQAVRDSAANQTLLKALSNMYRFSLRMREASSGFRANV